MLLQDHRGTRADGGGCGRRARREAANRDGTHGPERRMRSDGIVILTTIRLFCQDLSIQIFIHAYLAIACTRIIRSAHPTAPPLAHGRSDARARSLSCSSRSVQGGWQRAFHPTSSDRASASLRANPRTRRQQTRNVCTSPCWPAMAGGTAAEVSPRTLRRLGRATTWQPPGDRACRHPRWHDRLWKVARRIHGVRAPVLHRDQVRDGPLHVQESRKTRRSGYTAWPPGRCRARSRAAFEDARPCSMPKCLNAPEHVHAIRR